MAVSELRLIPNWATVADVRIETGNIWTFYLRLPEDFPTPAPGQFNMLYVHGVGEVPISVSDVTEEGLVAHTVRFTGTVTNMFRTLEKGVKIGVRGPYGKPWPLSKSVGKDILIVAGGIGLAPLRPVIREVKRNRHNYGKLTILYGARTPSDLLYRYEFSDYSSIENTEMLVTVDRGDASWKGHVGVVTKLIPKAKLDVPNTIAMVCGPEIMMRFTIKELIKLGFKDNQIYLSLERRMKCGTGLCGHCQMGPYFICKHGPVFPYWFIKKYFWVDEI